MNQSVRPPSNLPCFYCQLPVPGSAGAVELSTATAEPLFCCYGCRLAAEITHGSGQEAAVRWIMVRVGSAIFLTLNLMVFTMALWSPDVYGPGMADNQMERAYEDLFRHLSLLAAAPVMLLLGPPLARSAWAGLQLGRPGTDLLIVIGVWAAFLASMVSVLSGRGPIYFEVACVVLIFVTLGRWLEASGKLHTQKAMDDLSKLMPEEALVVRHGVVLTIAVDLIEVGDQLQLRPGDRVACDSLLTTGEATLDEQILTGESLPVSKLSGDKILGGSLVVEGTIQARVLAPVSQSTVARLIDHVRQARDAKGRYARMADRLATWLLPLVVTIAILAGLIHASHKGAAHGLLVALSLLLIACPCALGLATPLAVWSAMGAAARRGVLFSDGEALERLAEVDTVLFDKTGTLTTGRPVMVQSLWADNVSGFDQKAILMALASRSAHPLAKSLLESLRASDDVVSEIHAEHVQTRPGRGLMAFETVGSCEPFALLGSFDLLADHGVAISQSLAGKRDEFLRSGKSVLIFFTRLPQPAQALFGFDESLRPDVISAFDQLKSIRPALELAVLTGDHKQAGERLAESLQIKVLAGLMPEDKQANVRQYQSHRHVVAFVGEGYNDAPAMATADVGIALGAGADLTRDNASVCILGNDISAVPYMLELSRQTVRRIRRNLFWAFFYNIFGVALAACGLLSPTMAAAIMFASSVAVVAGSGQIPWIEPAQIEKMEAVES
jgi:heavy metal translocating P-type ATPase